MPKQREICLIPIPFTDLNSVKRRPVIIISNNKYNDRTDDVLVMAMTSNLADKNNTVLVKQEDFETGTLKTTSMIRIDKIFSLSQSLIIKTFGLVSNNKFNEVVKRLLNFLKSKNEHSNK